MANSRQATKRARQNLTKAENNNVQVTKMRTAIKKVHVAVETGEGDKDALFREAMKQIDRSATKGLIHNNKANRDKAKLAKLVQA
ncbi:30S ribosomal protein S20 [Suicoccus acidiformans]|uniref:Small ribosomal subunit protein bS20 n=1 Tax=Suicoccus acidiformans TaxID=2036206 RepID=A0A347WKM9_9LACT|nr:30S ribosomal protein S20 [Suicoccus acidiformans]AXY25636.1 30S ribosomal protein S20 [Suicoccus acidiformans]